MKENQSYIKNLMLLTCWSKIENFVDPYECWYFLNDKYEGKSGQEI